ncbi:MAG: NAD(P)/FAD-dependent oxidoreductase [Caulobacterales bacterium]
MDKVECVVIGAGVIGLAIARALAIAGRETIILEKGNTFGSGVSSRNSEVIHAGIYYPAGSAKARFCVAGRAMLYEYCAAHGVEHRRCGKLIVAADQKQLDDLKGIAAAAARNGVDDLRALSAGDAIALEPELRCAGALHSPSTGIIDTHGYMLSLLGDAEAHGAAIAYGANVSALEVKSDGIVIFLEGDNTPALKAKAVINCAGLHAPALTQKTAGLNAAHQRRGFLAKGNYFTLSGPAPFKRLVYPVPEPGGLGVHLTLDLGGQARFGPDVEWIETENYDVDPMRSEKFYAAVRAYWPGLKDGALIPSYAGIRPKLGGAGTPAADFEIHGPDVHGAPGLINLLGIESPGLTASLAIADHVENLVDSA